MEFGVFVSKILI